MVEAKKAQSWGISPQPVLETYTATDSIKADIARLLSLEKKVSVRDLFGPFLAKLKKVGKPESRNKRHRFLLGHEGTQFPKGTHTVHWSAHGFDTYLPWVGGKFTSKVFHLTLRPLQQ
jgi:hypothetical protein